jgi:hypothetical protein
MQRLNILFFTVLLCISSSPTLACFGWSSLTGYQVVEANDLQKFDCPMFGNYDCLTWPSSFYEWGYQCVNLPGYYGYGEEGILMSNGKSTQMVVIDGIGNTPSCYDAQFYNCPSKY